MGCKSGMYAVNQTAQEMALNGTIGFGNIVRKFGQNINLSGGNVVIQGAGYYNVSANFVLTAKGADVVTIALYKDGVPITGAVASETVVASDIATLTIPSAMIREFCCNESTITAVITGDASTVTNAAIYVEKL